MDKIIKCTAKDGMIRIIAGQTTELVNKGRELHNCTPVAAAAFGRMLTAGALMGSTLKSDKEVMTLKIDGKGEANGITVTAYENGIVKGIIGNPNGDLPLNSKGKLDVGRFVGRDGDFIVIKSLNMRDPYVGNVPIATGEIGEDLAYYFTVSEQTPSAVALGVLVDRDYKIKIAGGFIIQMMPDADELLADLLTYRLEEIPSITEMLSTYGSIEKVIEFIFEGMDLKILEEVNPEYRCNCSKERVEKALISIGREELASIYNDNKEEEVKCSFCNTAYKFTHEEIGQLIEQTK